VEQAGSAAWVAFVVANLFLIAWTYRCHRNLESLEHRNLDSKHIWALLCWFFPVLNLFCPYQVVREIWWRSHPLAANTPESAPASHLVFWWWLMRMTALGTVFLSYCFSPHESWPQYYTYFRIVFLSFICDLLDSISPFFSSCKSRSGKSLAIAGCNKRRSRVPNDR